MPDLVVLHYTAMTGFDAARDRLCDPAAEVSAHWLISAAGECLALVPEDLRAWHAGAGEWGGAGDVNSRSIGIELANDGRQPFAAAQMRALEDLLRGIMRRWPVTPAGVIGHSDMAPDRKADPGARFDWRRLAIEGLSVWPGENFRRKFFGGDTNFLRKFAPDPAGFRADLRRFGYSAGGPEEMLRAFRLRFRPMAGGPLDALDMALADDLARRFPVDGAVARA